MQTIVSRLAVITLAAVIAGPAHATDQTILGSSFKVKNPGAPDARRASVKAKEKASPNSIVGDPVANGATLTVRANGGTPSQLIISLPQGLTAKGKPYWSGDAIKGFKYSDPKGNQGVSPVKSLRLKKSTSGTVTMSVALTAKFDPLVLLPPNLGTSACVFLQIGGGGDSYSVQFTGGVTVNKTTTEYSHKKVTTEGSCAPTCSDAIQNGVETDIDCGGGTCPACAPGGICIIASDCTSGVCSAGVCQGPTCFDGAQNDTETDIDCGGSCALDCSFGQGCALNNDCLTTHCSGGLCKCANQSYTFTVNSNVGGAFDSAEWPGGQISQSVATGCVATINRPDANIDLVGGVPFSINSAGNYSSCFGMGGEDGDGCQPLTCPPAGIGSCLAGRPSCSAALNGSGSAQYFVQCLE